MAKDKPTKKREIKISADKDGCISISISGFSHIEALGLLRLYEQKQSLNILSMQRDK